MVDNSMLVSLFGTSSTSAAPMMSALAGFKPYVQNEPQKLVDYTKQSSYQKDIAYFKSHIGTVKSVDQLVKDPKLVNVLLTAFNLQADAQYPAKVKAILTSDLTDKSSYANRLIDPRYQQFAKTFNTALLGMTQFSNGSIISDVINKYTTNAYEKSLDTVNPALRSAAYFLRNIGSITDAYTILGDSVLRNVALTALGLPQEIANMPVEDQRRLIMSKIDIAKLETKGGAGSTSGAGGATTSTALDLAKADAAAILNDRNVAGSAQTEVQTIDERIVAVQKSYTDLAAIQDPAGAYAAEIPVQQAAAPGLVQQQGLLNAAQDAMGTVTADMTQLQKLIQQIGDPNNTTPLADLKTKFQTLHDEIVNKIAGATYQFDNGTGGATYTTQNLLDGSLSGQIAVTYDSKGDQTAVNAQNLGASSSFRTQLDAANTAFQAAFGSFDGTNIQAAATALSGAQTSSTYAGQTVGTDAANFGNAIAAVPQWAGTLNSASLYRGSQSLVDAGSRMTQINQLLGQIQSVANQSSTMDPTADRTALQNQYSDLVTKLGNLITTPGQTGVDNLLAANPNAATPGYYGYAIDTAGSFTLQARTHDLAGSVLTQLQGADVSSLTNANAVVAMVTGSIQTAVTDASQQLGLDSRTFALPASTLDPRTAVDSQYRQLSTDMAKAVANAGWLGSNLLDPNQQAITLNTASANMSIVIQPFTTYGTDVTQVLDSGSQKLPSDAADTSGALADLDTARFNNARVLGSIRSTIAQIDLATGITNAKITALTKQQQQQSASVKGVPINATPYAMQFVQKYLAAVDAKASASSGGSGNAYLVQLLQPLGN